MPESARNLSEWLDRSRLLRPASLWAVTAAATGALVLAGVLGLARAQAERPPPDRRAPVARRQGVLLLAGSGSNVPLTRLLAKACATWVPGVRIEVDTGIGSSGGVRALRDGVIDLALVSRPLRPQEADADMQVVPYARSPVAVAVHPAVTARGVSSAQLKAIFHGVQTVWPDGAPVVPLQREQGDSGHEAMARAVAGWAEVDASAWHAARWPVHYHDQALLDTLLTTPGALGLVDGASVRALGLPLPLLALDGRLPDAPDYPVWKPLAFVHRGPLSPPAADFLGCVRSAVGLDVLRRVGALPP